MKPLFKALAVVSLFACMSLPAARGQDDNGPGRSGPAPAPDSAPPPGDQSGDDQSVSFQNFYDQLGQQGDWVQTGDYGYVFQPNVTDPNWAPYTDGHWVYTEDGWTWVSAEPWGWATYHYGRWANIDGMGWVWVPGYRWAPAWVSWRYGGGYCGWAPLPPETVFDGGFHLGGDVDVTFGIGAGCYNFIAIGDMGDPNYRGRFANRYNNYSIINRTTNVTNIYNSNPGGGFQGITAKGPPLSEINAHARTHIPTMQLTAASQPGAGRVQGNSLAVYAPRVAAGSIKTGRPATVSRTIANPTFNRGNSVTKPLAVTASVKPPAPTSSQIQAARTAQSHAPSKAHIATATTAVKPLSSLAPIHKTTTSGAPAAERSAGGSAFTGESVKPSTETETRPATASHPQTEERPQTETRESAPAEHPQTEERPAETYHPESAPASHPQEESHAPAESHAPQESHAPAESHAAPAGRPAASGAKGEPQGNGKPNQ